MNLNLGAVVALLKHGADVNVVNEEDGFTPLFRATSNPEVPEAVEVVDALLRSGADETVVGKDGDTALEVVWTWTDEEQLVTEDYERVCELLENAPTDRAWRRRGFLVLCRAHPDRLCSEREIAGVRTGMNSRAKVASARTSSCSDGATTAGICTLDERTDGDRVGAAARVVELEEEGILRMIVAFL